MEMYLTKQWMHVLYGPSLETIKKIPNKMLVVSGKKKAAVIHAALKGGLADSLYIDAPTAEELLKKQF